MHSQVGEKLQDGVYYYHWKYQSLNGKTLKSKHLALSMGAAKEFIELCDSGDAFKNKNDMLMMLLQVEQQARGNATGSKVVYRIIFSLIEFANITSFTGVEKQGKW
jgi:hypothetical protein